MRLKIVFVLIFVVLFSGLVSASFNFSEEGTSINTQYGALDYLKAKINISFQNESINSVFEDSLGHSIVLDTLLEVNPDYKYEFNSTENTTIDSGFQVLDFNEANFLMPETLGSLTYKLNLDEIELFQKNFEIVPINNSVEEEIEKKYLTLNSSKEEIKKYDIIERKIISEFINADYIEEQLNELEKEYKNSSTDEEYDQILENLSIVEVPEKIDEITNTNPITFYPKREIINLDSLSEVFGGNYAEEEEGYINAIQLFNIENLTTKVIFKEISIKYDSGEEYILKIFRFTFDKRNLREDAYFVIQDMDNLKFEGDYSQNNALGYFYINLADVSDEIILSTTEDVDFLNIPVFASPLPGVLSPVGQVDYPDFDEESRISKWILFGLIIFLLLIIAIIAYIMLQIWYKRKYENYLFKNRNNLYNIMTYIQSSKKKEVKREEIIRNLKKSGWNGEQINYALRKYEGKKILGIVKNPFKKIIKKTE